MKKTILAVAVSGLLATTAQAATLYEADGITVNVFGDAEVQLVSDMLKDSDGDKNQGYIHIDDADFGFKMGYDIGNGLMVGGVVEFSGDLAKNTAGVGDVYVGVTGDFGTLTAGKHATILDDAGVGGDYKFGFDTVISDQDFSGTQVIKYKGDFENVYFGVATILNSANSAEDDYWSVDGKVGVRFAGADVAAFYGTGENLKNIGTDAVPNNVLRKTQTFILQGTYTVADFKFGAVFANSTSDSVAGDEVADASAYSLSANYYMNDWNFGVGGGYVDTKDFTEGGVLLADGDQTKAYANVGYSFTSNVHVFTELGFTDAKNDDDAKSSSDIGFAAGMQINF